MVKDCPECSEHSFATRYKDSYMSFCRNCGYYTDYELDEDDELVQIDGFLEGDEFQNLKARFPIQR